MNSTTPSLTLRKGDCFALVGDHYRVLATPAETAGQLFAMETIVSPGGGPPPHVHANEDETFYPIDGPIELWVGGHRQLLQPGELAYGPRGVPHRFRNPSDRPVRLQIQVLPGSSGQFFAEVAGPLPANGAPIPPPSEAEIRHLLEVAPRHGITILPPA